MAEVSQASTCQPHRNRDAWLAVVVVGEYNAALLSTVLQREQLDNPHLNATAVAVPDLDFDPEQLVLDVLGSGCRDLWLLLPQGAASREFVDGVAEAKREAGSRYPPLLSLLPEEWTLEDLVRVTSPRSGAFMDALSALWLAAGPHPDALKMHIEDLGGGV